MEGPRESNLINCKTILTCKGDIKDPNFPRRLKKLVCNLKRLISDGKKPFKITSIEPWNSVRVTFNIPHEAAQRLRQLAETGDNTLRELGILSVQLEGDQVITLTSANNFNETQSLLLEPARSDTINKHATSSASSSTPSSSPLINVHRNNALLTSSSSLNLIGSTSTGPSVEITRKNIAQYLSQQGTSLTGTNCLIENISTSSDVGTFKSPNKVAPQTGEPLPFLMSTNSTSLSPLQRQPMSSTVSSPSPSSSPSQSLPTSTNSSGINNINVALMTSVNRMANQSNVGPFPFASMQRAMHTKQGLSTSLQPTHLSVTSSVQLPFQLNVSESKSPTSSPSPSPSLTTPTTSSVLLLSQNNGGGISTSSPTCIRNPTVVNNIRVSNIVANAKNPQQTPPIHQPTSNNSAQSVTVHAVANSTQHVSCSSIGSTNNTSNSSASANVALTSPLLVNLLQSDASTGHIKMMPPPQAATSISGISELSRKRNKQRKPRKAKEKPPDLPDSQSSVIFNSISSQTNLQPFGLPSIKVQPHAVVHTIQQPPAKPPQNQQNSQQLQSQSLSSLSAHFVNIPGSSLTRYPSIHPEAQGQPQVVNVTNLHQQLGHHHQQQHHHHSQNKVLSTPIVGSPPVSTSNTIQVRRQLSVDPPQISIMKQQPQIQPEVNQKDDEIKKANELSTTSPSQSSLAPTVVNKHIFDRSKLDSIIASVSPSREAGKTKHLINPFTGHLEPLLSDEDEEEHTPHSLTLFAELEPSSTSVSQIQNHFDRTSVPDGGGRETLLSDTDSGVGKSASDASSQSSSEVSSSESALAFETNNNKINGDTSNMDEDKSKLDRKYDMQEIVSTSQSQSTVVRPQQPTPSFSSSIIAEPKVPPLHISLRGPNSAIVVTSGRRESLTELDIKSSEINSNKKPRSLRTTRTMSAESALSCDFNHNKNDKKKQQREQRFLSGGGIITSESYTTIGADATLLSPAVQPENISAKCLPSPTFGSHTAIPQIVSTFSTSTVKNPDVTSSDILMDALKSAPNISSKLSVPQSYTCPEEASGTPVNVSAVIVESVVTNHSSSLKLMSSPSSPVSISSAIKVIPQTEVESSPVIVQQEVSLITNNENSGSLSSYCDSSLTDIDIPRLEPVDMSVNEDGSISSSEDNLMPCIVPQPSDINNADSNDSDESDDEKVHSVASGDHNYIIVKNTSNGQEASETDLDDANDTDEQMPTPPQSDDKSPEMPELQPQLNHDFRPKKRKCPDSATGIMKTRVVEDEAPRRKINIHKNGIKFYP